MPADRRDVVLPTGPQDGPAALHEKSIARVDAAGQAAVGPIEVAHGQLLAAVGDVKQQVARGAIGVERLEQAEVRVEVDESICVACGALQVHNGAIGGLLGPHAEAKHALHDLIGSPLAKRAPISQRRAGFHLTAQDGHSPCRIALCPSPSACRGKDVITAARSAAESRRVSDRAQGTRFRALGRGGGGSGLRSAHSISAEPLRERHHAEHYARAHGGGDGHVEENVRLAIGQHDQAADEATDQG